MLSVPTLWTVFIINFLALGLIWAYVVHSYPSFHAARFWTGSSLVAAAGAAIAMLRVIYLGSLLPLLIGGAFMIFATCLTAMGIQGYYGKSVRWRDAVIFTAASFAVILFFLFVYDSALVRIAIYSVAQSVPLLVGLKLLLTPHEGRVTPGARLAAMVTMAIVGIYAVRVVAAATGIGGHFSYQQSSPSQAGLVLALVFLAMSLNFGLLLMAMDRLRNEVADLALMDDLTGVGNRRYLVQRLTEECGRSTRSSQPFTLLVIDLDGFKGINDNHGHAAGDACLQHFTLMTQTCLRPGDVLARSGGDEFCVVLPSSGLREGALVAQRILEICRADAAMCVGKDIPISVSIGLAQWTSEIGAFPDRLIAAADQALYDAKKNGRNGYAAFEMSPTLAPEQSEVALRKLA